MRPYASSKFEHIRAISQYLRAARERRGLSQVNAAHLAGMSETGLAYIERFEREIRLTTLLRLLDVYGLTLIKLSLDLHL